MARKEKQGSGERRGPRGRRRKEKGRGGEKKREGGLATSLLGIDNHKPKMTDDVNRIIMTGSASSNSR